MSPFTSPTPRSPGLPLPSLLFLAALGLTCADRPAEAQNVPVEEHTLENGLRLLLLPRKGDPNVSGGWIARVGSVNERPGITGIAHLFEHMMFKGTRVIGTRDIARNLEVMADLDRVKAEIAREEEALAARQRVGEVPTPARPEDRSPRHRELLAELEKLAAREREVLVKDEFDKIYTAAGASQMNAGTTNDFTIYFINVPANKLELWFWMESDRLLNPVFREFYSERDVVREERRLRIESTPIGRFQEELDALFWGSSPYGWPVIGWPSDIEAVTRDEALEFFGVYYAPNNLTACLVGDFDPARALDLAKRYFGRLKRGPMDPAPIRTREVPQLAERRMVAYAETKPQVRIRWHTVPEGHTDGFALSLLGEILSGKTGRLYKSLVLEGQIANEVDADQEDFACEGYFEARGVAKPGRTPEEVEKAIYAEIERLQSEPVPARELEKVKNQAAATNYRRLRSNFAILMQLLVRDAHRGWRSINTDPARTQAVTAEDIQRVAKAYFTRENRTIAVYYTKEGGGSAADPLLAGLSEEDQAQVKKLRAALAQAKPEQVRKMLEGVKQQSGAVPADKKAVLEAMQRALEQHLERLEPSRKAEEEKK